AGVHHAIHLQHGVVPAARRVRAISRAPPRTVGDRRRRDAWDVWRRHGGWRTRGHTGDEAAGFWNRDRAWTGDGIRRRGRDVADHDPADAVACGFELLPA